MSQPTRQGLFVGLLTLDLIYLVERLPAPNEKLVAADYLAAAGGPAANAAIAYRHFSQSATLLGVLGHHPLAQHIAADLKSHGVTLIDLAPAHAEPPPVSSILVTQSTGDRAVVSLNARRHQAAGQISPEIAAALDNSTIVLIDGHQMAIGAAIARQAAQQEISVVVDGGSWKPNFDQVLRWSHYAICSAQFRPPGCSNLRETLDYVQRLGVPHVAITRGAEPIIYRFHDGQGDRTQEIDVPTIQAVDTLGAGDIFHGVFCHVLTAALKMGRPAVVDALHQAAQVAALACTTFGTRQWMNQQPGL
ncbi:MAG: PfkB family carbohydrate kinase [Elainellaceae cyanobacterium]